MPQEYTVKEALKMAIMAKKNLMDFYLEAARITDNENGKKVFARLAGEVCDNARKFYQYYTWQDLGSFDDLMGQPPKSDSVILAELRKALNKDMHERKARELALKEEESMEKTFLQAAKHIIDPQVRAIFNDVARDTRIHYEIIASEYSRTMGMVHESDMDTYVRE
ncbi:ferritin family protein [Pelovirga terrestris]|uniref:Ferritin family protein n=1 Tax=Pelovirga terrestris TaxID=2771352 RepID=A0A8J6QY48_9BACT|nr:ferritin family protein [Pelovirga terrestris]MBD1401451.1 ferritin family protein [Pelovirga terrestris]